MELVQLCVFLPGGIGVLLINHNVGLLILPFLFRLHMSLVDLLCGEEEVEQTTKTDFMIDGQHCSSFPTPPKAG